MKMKNYNIYASPYALFCENTIEDYVMDQLQQEPEGIWGLDSEEFEKACEALEGTKHMPYSVNAEKIRETIDLYDIRDLMEYISVDQKSLSFQGIEDDMLVYTVDLEIDLPALVRSAFVRTFGWTIESLDTFTEHLFLDPSVNAEQVDAKEILRRQLEKGNEKELFVGHLRFTEARTYPEVRKSIFDLPGLPSYTDDEIEEALAALPLETLMHTIRYVEGSIRPLKIKTDLGQVFLATFNADLRPLILAAQMYLLTNA